MILSSGVNLATSTLCDVTTKVIDDCACTENESHTKTYDNSHAPRHFTHQRADTDDNNSQGGYAFTDRPGEPRYYVT